MNFLREYTVTKPKNSIVIFFFFYKTDWPKKMFVICLVCYNNDAEISTVADVALKTANDKNKYRQLID